MQANDDNENKDDALEGLTMLNEENPYEGAPIHRIQERNNFEEKNRDWVQKSEN